jgi:hypothetical protein
LRLRHAGSLLIGVAREKADSIDARSDAMMKLVLLGTIMLATLPALAQEPGTADEAKAADMVADNADDIESSKAADPGTEAFVPPPGFKTKKHGKLTVYCMRDSTVGTRFKTEKCYDESQMRDYLAAQQEQKRDIERVRSTCGTGSVCAPQ